MSGEKVGSSHLQYPSVLRVVLDMVCTGVTKWLESDDYEEENAYGR